MVHFTDDPSNDETKDEAEDANDFIVRYFADIWSNFIELLHFVAFFHVVSLLSTGVDNKKVAVDNEKAPDLTNSIVFHSGRQWKSSRAGQQNIFFIF